MLKFICDRCGVELKNSLVAFQVIEVNDKQQKIIDNIHYCNKCYPSVKLLILRGEKC